MENKIKVEFINAMNNELMGVSEMPATQLPETFEIATTLNLNNMKWSVEEAIPKNAIDFIKSKHLVLKLRQIETVDPKDILFSLPTISNEIGGVVEKPLYNDFEYQIHEDTWRQYEFLNKSTIDLVKEELESIQNIWKNHWIKQGEMNAFDQCHLRVKIPQPNLKINFKVLTQLLNTQEIGSLKYSGNPNFVADAFVLKTEHATYFGILENELVTQLCIAEAYNETPTEIRKIVESFDLIFVDWSNCEII